MFKAFTNIFAGLYLKVCYAHHPDMRTLFEVQFQWASILGKDNDFNALVAREITKKLQPNLHFRRVIKGFEEKTKPGTHRTLFG